MHDPTSDPITEGLDTALAHLREVLGPDGWRVYRKGSKIKARWRWYRITLRHRADQPEGPWHARMRDVTPLTTVTQHRAPDPIEALRPVVAKAKASARFCQGRLGLFRNPSKSDLAHRLLAAVRPLD